MPDLHCTRCDKRLSRKSARLIDGKVLCSTCMFAPAKPAFDKLTAFAKAEERAGLERLGRWNSDNGRRPKGRDTK